MEEFYYKGYQGTVEYCAEEDCLIGKVIGLPTKPSDYRGRSIDELKENFKKVIDNYLAYLEDLHSKPMRFRNPFPSGIVPEWVKETGRLFSNMDN